MLRKKWEPKLVFINKNLGGYFLQKIKNEELELLSENLFKIKQLTKGINFTEQETKDCVLITVLYTAIVEPLLEAIGIMGTSVPYFEWSELGYESIMLQFAIDALTKDLGQ